MKIPPIIYGTAWKKDRTSELVVKAITTGFRGIDTAGQPKHYFEKGVGDALEILGSQGISRSELFIQTKFTPISGQDPQRLPYDPKAPLSQQVQQSFASSQANLKTSYVDSLVLHSPLQRWDQLLEVWTAMEAIYQQGEAKRLGISNCYDLKVLQLLCQRVKVQPSVVQNRFYADTSYDVELRAWCLEKGMTYQSFWSLTANPHILQNPSFRGIAQGHQRTEAQVFLRFLTQMGIVPLTGTCSEIHMKQDLEIFQFELTPAEMGQISSLLAF